MYYTRNTDKLQRLFAFFQRNIETEIGKKAKTDIEIQMNIGYNK